MGDGDIQTRREFLHSIGNIGGSAAVYQAMISMGLLMPGDATGAELRDKWASKSSQILEKRSDIKKEQKAVEKKQVENIDLDL